MMLLLAAGNLDPTNLLAIVVGVILVLVIELAIYQLLRRHGYRSDRFAALYLATILLVNASILGIVFYPPLRPHTGYLVAGLICLIGVQLGFSDFLRLSLTRIWAISNVAFSQAIRRRVLWLTPLVVVAVVVVSQLAQPVDAQDDIRQTIKFLLFASGMLVTLLTILLTCTNLPKEIESRVIYTIATKPTTRLEIIIGKVLGFARVSAAILILMGAFSLGYLRFKQWRLEKVIASRLAATAVLESDPAARQTLIYYREQGLLHARAFHPPGSPDTQYDPALGLQVFARPPSRDTGTWSIGGGEQYMLVPVPNFIGKIPPQERRKFNEDNLGFKIRAEIKHQSASSVQRSAPPATSPAAEPNVSMAVTSETGRSLGAELVKPAKEKWLVRPGDTDIVEFDVDAKVFELVPVTNKFIYFSVAGQTPGQEYAIRSFHLFVPQLADNPQIAARDGVFFHGRTGTLGGQQVRGESDGKGPIAVYQFTGAPSAADAAGNATFEIRCGVERGGEQDLSSDLPTNAQIIFYNIANPAVRETRTVLLEHNRVAHVSVPATVLAGGKFKVSIRCLTTGHWLTLRDGAVASLRLVRENQSFELNLLKSLLVMWLMSVLAITVAIFSSTFLSWPIAVVMTIVILLGHWGVEQMGDISDKSMIRQIVPDIFGKGVTPAQAHTLGQAVEALTGFLTVVSRLLPDISQFEAIEKIEVGTAIPLSTLLGSARVAFGFGIPLIVLSYLILRFKEVAP